MGGCLSSSSNCEPTIGSSYTWVWTNLQHFIRCFSTCKVVWVIIGNFPTYNYLDFVAMVVSLLDEWNKQVPCKHLYYVLQHVMFCGEFEDFIHFLTWNTCDVIQHLLAYAIISH